MPRRRLPSAAGAAGGGGESGATDEPAAAAADAWKLAASWLSRRDYCSAQLAGRLTQRGFDASTVQAALSELIERRFVDDARYARAFVAVHAGRGQGPVRIRHELSTAGLSPDLAEQALEEYAAEQGGWAGLARRVRSRRFGAAAPQGRAEWARQARFLHYRGFSTDHIRSALGDEATDGAESA